MNRKVNRDPWFFCNKPKPQASVRLFCFPFSGGGASIYRSWPDAMGNEIEVQAVQLPGRETRYNEARELNINVLVKNIVKALEIYQDKPFAFFGYSLGALLAFEVCRALAKHNMNAPIHLFVAAMRAPQTARIHEPLSPLPDEKFIQQVEYYYQPQGEAWNNSELRDLFMPVLKDDMALADNYIYLDEMPLSCPIDVFTGKQDLGAPPHLTATWHEQTSDKTHYHGYQGGHFFIEEHLKDVQSVVLETLESKFIL